MKESFPSGDLHEIAILRREIVNLKERLLSRDFEVNFLKQEVMKMNLLKQEVMEERKNMRNCQQFINEIDLIMHAELRLDEKLESAMEALETAKKLIDDFRPHSNTDLDRNLQDLKGKIDFATLFLEKAICENDDSRELADEKREKFMLASKSDLPCENYSFQTELTETKMELPSTKNRVKYLEERLMTAKSSLMG